MSNLSTEQRKKLPASDFAGPDRSFPIVDQDDVDSAARLIGKADDPEAVKRKIIAIAKRKGLKIPDAWKEANMSVDYIERPAMLFEAGEYPDKKISVTAEDLTAIAAGTTEAPVIVGHEEEEFKLGTVGNLYARGSQLWGTLRLDRASNEVVERNGIKSLSVSLKRTKDGIAHVGITSKPRVAAAAMFMDDAESVALLPANWRIYDDQCLSELHDYARFAGTRHDTELGQSAVQQLHDTAARLGAVCKRANMASRHEADAIQQVHDLTAEHGAKCHAMGQGAHASPSYAGIFTHNEAAQSGRRDANMSNEDAKSFMDHVRAFFTGSGGGQPSEQGGSAGTTTEESGVAAARVTTPPEDPRVAQMAREVAQMKAERAKERAETFADHLERDGKSVPAERAAIMAAFCQAAADDEAHPATVTFTETDAEGKPQEVKGSRLDILKRQYESRQTHGLFGEAINVAEMFSLPQMQRDASMSGSNEDMAKQGYEQGKKFAEQANGKGAK